MPEPLAYDSAMTPYESQGPSVRERGRGEGPYAAPLKDCNLETRRDLGSLFWA